MNKERVAPGLVERRCKLLYVDEQEILNLLVMRENDLPDICSFRIMGLPEDVEVMSVHRSPERRAFMFRIAHPTFDAVPAMDILPEVKCKWEPRKVVAIAKEGSNA